MALDHGAWLWLMVMAMAHGTWIMAHGTWLMAIMAMADGSWRMVHTQSSPSSVMYGRLIYGSSVIVLVRLFVLVLLLLALVIIRTRSALWLGTRSRF
jgi:hypothetical protein